MTAEWLIALFAGLTFVGGLIATLWKFSKAVDRNTIITQQILDQQKAQWSKLDVHEDKVADHDQRIIKLETWQVFHKEEAAR